MNRFQNSLLSAILMASLSSCTTVEEIAGAEDGTLVTMDWSKGDTFYLATSYRRTNVKTDELPVDLDEAFAGNANPEFGENWTDDVIWTYQIVESGFVPSVDDELYRFAETETGIEPLAVIKASVDVSLNTDSVLLSADPIVYMVFREDRDRMVGLITFINVNGERTERAYSASELDRSWSTLSQSMLTQAPTYLAPYSSRWGNDERTLENGSTVTSVKVDESTTDVYYTDEMGGGMVVSRYEAGRPWPTWTTTGNVDIRMITESDVDSIRFGADGIAARPENEDFDYRAALQTSIDIDAALTLDLEELASGRIQAEVAQEYKPWAGSWWALKKGKLVWGYDSRPTFSNEIRSEVDPLKEKMDELSEKIRDMDDDDDDREELREEYTETQTELVKLLKEFYNGLLEDIDGGKVVIADGKITNTDEEDGWEYEINKLSPMDKYAVTVYLDGNTYPNPFLISAWEILNSYNPGGESWWGHCNGWAAAAILTHEPREAITFEAGGHEIEFTTADVKGLLTESHYSTFSQFYGERYNGEDDDVTDLSPKAFHKLLTFFIDELGVPMVFDTTATEAVWNFPAYGYDLTISETTDPAIAELLNVNTATAKELAKLPGLGDVLAARIVERRYYNGAFQSVHELIDIDGIGDVRFAQFKDLVTIEAFARTFDVSARVTLTTDGVGETHVDGDEPSNFSDTWGYSLKTDANGLVVGGEWKRENDHPDFAWIPYHNTSGRETGGSENPFLSYGQLLGIVGDDIERK
jgi:competence ComEA-like helix-hairpin-helix protein